MLSAEFNAAIDPPLCEDCMENCLDAVSGRYCHLMETKSPDADGSSRLSRIKSTEMDRLPIS